MKSLRQIEEEIDTGIQEILSGSFFEYTKKNKLKKESWIKFIKQKYAGVSYFIPLILHATKITGGFNPLLSKVFFENYCDEVGIFAGEYRPEYAHSFWREKSLKQLGSKFTKSEKIINCLQKHNTIMTSLVNNKNPMVVVGGLMFLEHFVVFEMRRLIELFERDMPKDFIKDTYDPDKFPNNNHEYWYSHATHDVWHYQQIREALRTYVKSLNIKEKRKVFKDIQTGINIVINAKKTLYSKELFEHIS